MRPAVRAPRVQWPQTEHSNTSRQLASACVACGMPASECQTRLAKLFMIQSGQAGSACQTSPVARRGQWPRQGKSAGRMGVLRPPPCSWRRRCGWGDRLRWRR
eukprot:9474057-Pyramimonas_sp.AAC.1